MHPDPLETTLAACAREPLPSAPPDLASTVWREIDRRRRASFWSRARSLLDWDELFSEPRLAAPALVCALAIGALPALFWTQRLAQQRLARHSIHFEVFTSPPLAQLVADRPALAPPGAHAP